MTTRAELLDAFEAKLAAEGSYLMDAPGSQEADKRSLLHEEYTSQDGTRTTEWHKTYRWDRPGQNVIVSMFYVEDRGTPGEEADWHQSRDPKPDPTPPTFQQEMIAWVESQIDEVFGALTLRHLESATGNANIQRGTVDVVMETGMGDFVRRSAAVWKDASEVWQFKVIIE